MREHARTCAESEFALHSIASSPGNWPDLAARRDRASPGDGATPAGGESGGRRTVRLRGGRAGTVTYESLRGTGQSYQPVRVNRIRPALHLCCRIAGTSAERASSTPAAFSDPDKTSSRDRASRHPRHPQHPPSTLRPPLRTFSAPFPFAPSFYQHGLITRSGAIRGTCAQVIFRAGGAGPSRMARPQDRVGEVPPGRPADKVGQIAGNVSYEAIVRRTCAAALIG